MKDYSEFLLGLKQDFSCDVFIGRMLGCEGDAYKCDERICTNEAIQFHAWKVNGCRETHIDYLFAAIMPNLSEDGCLLDGTSIHEAICTIDEQTKKRPI